MKIQGDGMDCLENKEDIEHTEQEGPENTFVREPVSKNIYPHGKPVTNSKDLEIHLDTWDCSLIDSCVLGQEMAVMSQAQT